MNKFPWAHSESEAATAKYRSQVIAVEIAWHHMMYAMYASFRGNHRSYLNPKWPLLECRETSIETTGN